MIRVPALACLLTAGLLLAAPAAAAEAAAPPAPANDDCLACHDDPAATRADNSSVAVSGSRFAASIHGQLGLACVDCHADLAGATEFPHGETLAKVNCATCHQAAADQDGASVHGQLRKSGKNGHAASCVDCHGSHDIRTSTDAESRTYALNLPQTCGRCHGNDAVIREAGHTFNLYQESVHGRAVSKSGLLVSANCTSCHGAHDITRANDPRSHVARANVPGTCAKCHEGIATTFAKGAHGQQLQRGNTAAPVCSDCHSSHQIRRVDVEEWKLAVVQECGTCHQDKIQTYRDTFHGKVTELGFTRVATCADCHGSHEVLPAGNARSLVSPQRRLQTCQTCHPGAPANFAAYDSWHADPHNYARNPVLWYAAELMKWLLAGVFIFFGVHTLLWIPQSLRQRRAARSSESPHV